MGRIKLIEGDITEQDVDAIVNAANSALVLGSGVAGAIAARGGPSIQEECSTHGAIEVGDAAITGAGALSAKFVVHAAGMPPGGVATEGSVRSSVARSLALAAEHGCRTIACPAVGAGVGGLSLQRSAEISLEEAHAHLDAADGTTKLEEIRFVLFGEPAYRVFEMVDDAARVKAQMERLKNR